MRSAVNPSQGLGKRRIIRLDSKRLLRISREGQRHARQNRNLIVQRIELACGELEVGAVVVGSPVPQAAAGVPCFGRFDNSGFFAECEHAEKRVSPLATEFAEVTHGRTE